ncbi:putative galactinol--sucrose galactosyltransferase 1 [Zea mays]|uniref:Putative galactinol--sucrose galactosyltransferase 1 n=1 Tax=Zea mays TaxID=4577 RepID=A0A1D6KI38_MAIZE|nr:putative galactinol--sucrose galactosyltransferase 1 [Zea mays]
MTVGAGIAVQDGSLLALGAKVLREVRGNVLVTPAAGGGLTNGAFLGVRSAPAASRSIFPVGKLRDQRFVCTFRFKMWWMTQRMGSAGRDIPSETQFLLVEVSGGGEQPAVVYTVFLPVLEGSFRAVLQGNADDELEICLESGDPDVESFQGSHLVFVGAGSDPFEVITSSVKAVERHLQTFSHREKKKMPDILNWFGWCTWDAFYTNVTAQGVKQGLQRESARILNFLCCYVPCVSFANRLTHIRENHKFQKNGREGHREDDPAKGLAHVVNEIKGKHQLKYVYVWHAITGYWGGVRPGAAGMEHYGSKMQRPVPSPGVQKNERCEALDSMTANGLGLVNLDRAFSFYDELHSSKRSAVIRASDDFWPRDPASHTIHVASVAYNTVFLGEFMQPDWDMFHSVHPMAEYHAAARAVGGCAIYVSDKPGSHDFNLLKKLVLPDGSILRAKLPGRPTRDCLFSDPARDGKSVLKIWNLNEHSGVVGAFNCQGAGWCRVAKKNLIHDQQPGTVSGVIRAQDVEHLARVADHGWNGDVVVYSHVGGEVVYLPKNALLPVTLRSREYECSQDMEPERTLRHRWRLQLSRHWLVPGSQEVPHPRPPAQNGEVVYLPKNTLLPVTLRSREYEVFTVVPLKHLPNGVSFAEIGLLGMFNSSGAVRELRFSGEVVYLPKNALLPVTLRSREYEVFTVVPLKHLPNDASFAAIGLLGMFNSGGAVRELRFSGEDADVELRVRGSGTVGAYSSTKPTCVAVDSKAVGFSYDGTSGLISFELGIPDQEMYLWTVTVGY